MRYLWVILFGLLLWTACNDEDKLIPSSEPEFRYILPQGNHDYDNRIVSWFDKCGITILYKYESKDVFYNQNQKWAGFVLDSLEMENNLVEVYNPGYLLELPDEAYVGEQLEWIEEMLLNHYPTTILANVLPRKIILGKNLQLNLRLGNGDLMPRDDDYNINIANTFIFSHGDETIETLSLFTKCNIKEELNMWVLERATDFYPDLEEFYAQTDYSLALSSDYWMYWDGEGYLGRVADTEEAAKIEDLNVYIEGIINHNMENRYIPYYDETGKIALKRDLLLAAFKKVGIDLQVIADQYY